MIYRKLFVHQIDSEGGKLIATFENPGTIPIQGSIVTLTENSMIDISELSQKVEESKRLMVLSVHPSEDNGVEHFNIRVMKVPS